MRTLCIGVFALGLMVGVAGAAAADGETPVASYVSGTIVESFGPPPESVEADDVDRLLLLSERDVDWSDPRLPSRMLTRTLMDTREGLHPEGSVWPSVIAISYRLEDADGAWVGGGHGFDASPEAMPSESFGPMGVELATLSGEGAYEGLSAILVLYVDVTDWGAGEYVFEGYIYEGEPPPVLDPIEPGLSLGE